MRRWTYVFATVAVFSLGSGCFRVELIGDTPGTSTLSLSPTSYRFSDHPCFQGVPDTGACGSDYAFQAIYAYGEMRCLAGLGSVSYSPQQLVDCGLPYGTAGCNGGALSDIFDFMRVSTLATAAAYPYTATTGACAGGGVAPSLASNPQVTTVASMKSWLIDHGPLVVQVDIDATALSIFTGTGIFAQAGVDSTAFRIVGWDQSGGTPYWICSGAYGTGLGDQGFVNLPMGSDFGGIESNAFGLVL